MERPDSPNQLLSFESKMKAENLPTVVMDAFSHYYERLVGGETGLIYDRNIQPVNENQIRKARDLTEYTTEGRNRFPKAVMIRLNGGLGTSMGLTRAKSFIPVRGNRSFLDIILRQTAENGARLALMNSFSTHDDTVAYLASTAPQTMPLMFIQNKFPKVMRSDMGPVRWDKDPRLEWNPPGHGDVFTALYTSGVLDQLLDAGIRHALIANSDNLGATLDPALLGYVAAEGFPFMMEVAQRTPSDNKGGHLARYPDGGFLLRESAQCPPEEMGAFEDIEIYRFFNTNNIWIDLTFLKDHLKRHGALRLPVIVNPKTVDPRDKKSPPVFQLETAMGAAIAAFPDATAVHVPRARFMPVKKCNDLLAMRSDCYVFQEGYRLMANPLRTLPPIKIRLDSRFYGMIDDLDARFPAGPPSLLACESMDITGDIGFRADITLKGRVSLVNTGTGQAVIEAGAVIEGSRVFSD